MHIFATCALVQPPSILLVSEILWEAEENRQRGLASGQEAAALLSEANLDLNLGDSVSFRLHARPLTRRNGVDERTGMSNFPPRLTLWF